MSNLLQEIKNRDNLVAQYNLKTDSAVRTSDRKKFLGLLMVRAAEQGNVALMDDCYNNMINSKSKESAWPNRLACVALSLVNKKTDVLHHLLEDVHEYSSGYCFAYLLNTTSQTQNLTLFDQIWTYVVTHDIPLHLHRFNFAHILSGRNELERLIKVDNHLDLISKSGLKDFGFYAIDGIATDVINNFVLKKQYNMNTYVSLLGGCASLPPSNRRSIGKIIFDHIPTSKHQEFVLEYVSVGKENFEALKDVTADLASYLNTLSNSQGIKNLLVKTPQNPMVEYLISAMTADRLTQEISTVDRSQSTPVRKI